MKRILLAALLAMTVSPALAAEDSILLQCAGPGLEDDEHLTENIRLSIDGSNIDSPWGQMERRKIRMGKWFYYMENEEAYESQALEFWLAFNPIKLLLDVVFTEDKINTTLACFPITNPFTQE
jgi:hypothetical protein